MIPGSPRDLAARLPDEPRWIDLRGLLLSGRCQVHAGPELEQGFVAVSRDFPFGGLWSRPGAETIRDAAACGRAAFAEREAADEWQLLAVPEARPVVAAALPGWRRRGIRIHRLGRSLERPPMAPEIEVQLFADGHGGARLSLDPLPAASRRELNLDFVAGRPIAAAMIGGRLVSYCYAAFTTERLWDVAVETAEPYRRRGLAAACFLTLAAHMERSGQAPTWGAMEDNEASLALAARLGFVPDADLDGWAAAG